MKSLTEAIRRLEANARDSDFDIPSQRALHHSVSCGTIIVDHRTVGHGGSDMSASGKLQLFDWCITVKFLRLLVDINVKTRQQPK